MDLNEGMLTGGSVEGGGGGGTTWGLLQPLSGIVSIFLRLRKLVLVSPGQEALSSTTCNEDATISGYPTKSDGVGVCWEYGGRRVTFMPKGTESPRAR